MRAKQVEMECTDIDGDKSSTKPEENDFDHEDQVWRFVCIILCVCSIFSKPKCIPC